MKYNVVTQALYRHAEVEEIFEVNITEKEMEAFKQSEQYAGYTEGEIIYDQMFENGVMKSKKLISWGDPIEDRLIAIKEEV
jgi:hypothetical protein